MNGFALFVKEKFLDSGIEPTMAKACGRAKLEWEKLSSQQRKEYKRRAAIAKQPYQSSCPDCLQVAKESGARAGTCYSCFKKDLELHGCGGNN
jgi:hypothetical protein